MNLKDTKPFNIDAYLGKAKNRVALIGVELEGGWVELPKGVDRLVEDSSVFQNRKPAGVNYIGELPIGPMLPASAHEMLRLHYPQKINHTCGMHIHMSFDSLWHYQLLMVPEYPVTVVEYLKKWATDIGIKDTHPIWPRLRHESEYCQNEFWPDAQATRKDKGHNRQQPGHRYTHVHYCGARLRTIEIRTLPMMDKFKTAVAAVKQVIAITNAALCVAMKNRGTKPSQSKIVLPDNLVYEETIIEQL